MWRGLSACSAESRLGVSEKRRQECRRSRHDCLRHGREYNNSMGKIALLALSTVAFAATPFQASFESNAKQWDAIRGSVATDSSAQHDKRSSLRVEASK